jgi:hypothetical protein
LIQKIDPGESGGSCRRRGCAIPDGPLRGAYVEVISGQAEPSYSLDMDALPPSITATAYFTMTDVVQKPNGHLLTIKLTRATAQQVVRKFDPANVTRVVADKEDLDAQASQHRYTASYAGRGPLCWREPTASAGKQLMAIRALPEFITTFLTVIAGRLDGVA